MTETTHFALPLVADGQAQKHVTVNEALSRLDAFSNLIVQGIGATVPPGSPSEGDAWVLGSGCSGAWTSEDRKIASFLNGGWIFHEARDGAFVWDASAEREVCLRGGVWRTLGSSVGAAGAQTVQDVVSFRHVIGAGATSMTTGMIPSHSSVIGVTTRVVQPIVGSGTTGFRLGVSGSDNRYGSGLGLALNSWSNGLTGQPVTYYGDEPLVFTAEGGDFVSGEVEVAIHLWKLVPPDAV